MSRVLEQKICDLVRGYGHLYDSTEPGYRNTRRCRRSWEEIAAAVELPVKTVQYRWNLARDRFVRAHGKAERSGDASGGPDHPVLMQLDWLRVHVSHRKQSSKPDGSLSPCLRPGGGKKRRRRRRRVEEDADPDPEPVDATLLEELQELRGDEQQEVQSRNVFSTFTAFLDTFLQDLPPADGKKLMKEIQQLMLTYG